MEYPRRAVSRTVFASIAQKNDAVTSYWIQHLLVDTLKLKTNKIIFIHIFYWVPLQMAQGSDFPQNCKRNNRFVCVTFFNFPQKISINPQKFENICECKKLLKKFLNPFIQIFQLTFKNLKFRNIFFFFCNTFYYLWLKTYYKYQNKKKSFFFYWTMPKKFESFCCHLFLLLPFFLFCVSPQILLSMIFSLKVLKEKRKNKLFVILSYIFKIFYNFLLKFIQNILYKYATTKH